MRFLGSLNRRVALDLGTTRIRIWSDQDDTMIDQPACLAVDQRTQKVLAVGDDAAAMVGRVGQHVKVFYPLKHSTVVDPELTQALLKVLLQRLFRVSYFFRPIIMVSVPTRATAAQRAALIELMYGVGAREVYTISQSLAAAIGSGVPIADASGSLIMQLGGGSVEAAVISLGSVVTQAAVDQAGLQADLLIKQRLQEKLGLLVSLAEAQRLKHLVGSVNEGIETEALAAGQDVVATSPKEVMISSSLLRPTLLELAHKYELLTTQVLSTIAPELTADVIDKGMLLSGGWAQLAGLDSYLVAKLGIPVSVVEEPAEAVVKGIQVALENLELFRQSLGYLQ